jgi:hypothetical protein
VSKKNLQNKKNGFQLNFWLFHCILGLSVAVVTTFGQSKTYSPKNGILNYKAIILGGAFRVSTAIPLHGDFSKFNRVEIVRLQSRIGSDTPPELLKQLTDSLRAEFERGGRFTEVKVVNSFHKPERVAPTREERVGAHDFREADPLEAPMRDGGDMQAFDEQRRLAALLEGHRGESAGVLTIVGEVIDYAKGNKLLQLLPIDLWNSLLTVRFSYYDMETGEELGRQIVSSDNSSKVVPRAFSPRNALTGIREGLVDQITRRKVAAER